ncbi:ARPP-1 family domain-containing protein [Bradyrhizobium erythrophlei]|uniref:ARPP-1 family domain-containing protein n=1 Tax=Bradyrhizobium erythrophlei TaxID=1437360 RepID=UPI0035E754BA
MTNRWKTILIGISLCLRLGSGAHAEGAESGGYRLSDPVVHGNLAIYFVHGMSRSGPVPLTLQEALARKAITVRETGQVNELQVENTGDEGVFIQSGDIVKGGQQDRVLSVSLLLPPHSGAIPIASFCVESGRWSARGDEDARSFSSANASLPSRIAKLALARAAVPKPADGAVPSGSRQQQVWKSVEQIQHKLSSNLGVAVAAPQSHTSLELSLNDRLAREQADYISALQGKGEQGDDIIGYVFAVNGKVNSADIYPSNGLFRKMWPKLLRASVTEAIGEGKTSNLPAPPARAVNGFIVEAEKSKRVETRATKQTTIGLREGSTMMSLESRPAAAAADAWIYRSYIAK